MKRRTQEERTEEARRRLIDAATELFAERGYAATTTAEIGDRAGVSRGLVGYHFGTKEGCIRAVLADIRQNSGDRLAGEAGDATGLERIEVLCGSYLRGTFRGRPQGKALYVAMVESVTSRPELRDLTSEGDALFRGYFAAALEAAIEEGEIDPDTDVELVAMLIVGLLRGVTLQWMVDPGAVDLERAVPRVKATVRALVGTQKLPSG